VIYPVYFGVTKPDDVEIEVTRDFPALRALVSNAFARSDSQVQRQRTHT